MKGKKYPPEARARMGRKKGCENPHKRGPRSPEERARISAGTRRHALRGTACPAYRDGKVAERRGERYSRAAKRWRADVFARDGYTCRDCGDARGGNLQAHHVLPRADCPEHRFDMANGVTLCRKCHKQRHARTSRS
jgi:5-methylcytosine-specific restriction endonuclease McrA